MNKQYKEKLERAIIDLHQLGVKKNSAFLVHSSLKSLGDFNDRAEIIIEAICARKIAKNLVIPAVIRYQAELADSIIITKSGPRSISTSTTGIGS